MMIFYILSPDASDLTSGSSFLINIYNIKCFFHNDGGDNVGVEIVCHIFICLYQLKPRLNVPMETW